jgi:hypothetical protein
MLRSDALIPHITIVDLAPNMFEVWGMPEFIYLCSIRSPNTSEFYGLFSIEFVEAACPPSRFKILLVHGPLQAWPTTLPHGTVGAILSRA